MISTRNACAWAVARVPYRKSYWKGNHSIKPLDHEDRTISIEEIGGTSTSSLSLRGTVLVHKSRSWAGRSSIFIPIECLSISRSTRMDGAALMRGMRVLVLSLAAVALGVMPLTLLPSRWAVYAAMFLLPLVGAIAFGAGTYFMVALVRFMRRKPTVCIDAAMDEGHVRIECWETPDRRKDLDALLETVQKLQKKVDDLVPYPAEVSFHLFHMRPLRVHLLQATAITLILLLPVRWLAEYAQLPFLYLFLLLPFVWYLGMHAIEKLQMMAEPKLFREAVADYEMERLHEASLKLRSLLATQPDHLPGLILRAQTATLQGDFRSAFECCDRIDPIDDDLSDSLRDEILAIERLHKRMGE